MSNHHAAADHTAGHAAHGDAHYVKVYITLLVLLSISILGPMLEIKTVTLITAFGIAIVKAYLVAVNFMHINLTPRFVVYTFTTTLVFMLLFFAGTAPDVMKSHGTNWEKPGWIAAEKAYAEGDIVGASFGAAIQGHGEAHSEGHGEGHSEGHEAGHDAAAGHENAGH
ncbi:MAG: hypothetical protein R3F21_21745 [Myxococcota bacterium]